MKYGEKVCRSPKEQGKVLPASSAGRQKKRESCIAATPFFSRGTTRNRTGDTRIFSPLLYQLSYGTILFASKSGTGIPSYCECKGKQIFRICKSSAVFFSISAARSRTTAAYRTGYKRIARRQILPFHFRHIAPQRSGMQRLRD